MDKMLLAAMEFIKSPSEALYQGAQRKDIKTGFIFIGLQSLAFALLIIVATKRGAGLVTGMFLGDSYSSMSYLLGNSFKIPYFSIFLRTLFSSFFLTCIIGVLCYILARLFDKSAKDYKSFISAWGVACLPIICVSIVSILLAFISINLVVILFIGALIFTLLLHLTLVEQVFTLNKDLAKYIIVLSYLVPILLGTRLI